MHNSKNHLALAELKFSYAHYSQILKLENTSQAGELLLKLWQEDCLCNERKKYCLFLDSANQLIAWKHLPDSLDYSFCAKEIAGMAIACSASSIILSHHRLHSAAPNSADRALIDHTFKMCERIAVEILDYLIITPSECVSYNAWLAIN